MDACWRIFGFHNYPAPSPAVVRISIKTSAQVEDQIDNSEGVCDLLIYFNRPKIPIMGELTFTAFFQQYNCGTLNSFPQYYQDHAELEND